MPYLGLAVPIANTSDIADSAVTSAKIADDAVITAKIIDRAVTGQKIAEATVGSFEIANGAITNVDVNASAAIDATKIADGTVTDAEFQRINTLSSNAQTQLDAKSPTAGNASLVTTGTIATGVWNGTAVADGYIASAGTWNTATTTANAALPKAGGTMTGTLAMADAAITRPEITDYSETKTALVAAASIPIDMTYGNVFTITPDQNTTFTFTNPSPTGKSCAFTLIWTQGGSDRTIAWPASVDWAGGSAPDVTSGSGKIDIYTFFTLDEGTIWYGFQAGADMG